MNTTKKIKQIDIVFENCEVAVIPVSEIYNYGLADITQYHYMCNSNQDHKGLRAKGFFIIFEDLENLKYIPWGDDPEKSVFERITKYQDICHIDIIYSNGKNEYITVPWGSKDHYHNAFQIIRKLKSGRYEIEIEEGWNLTKLCNYIKHKIKSYKWQISWRYRKYIKKDPRIWW